MGNDQPTDLSPAERGHLRHIAGIMIPADPDYGVPAASDPVIFADILATLGPDRADISDALAALSKIDAEQTEGTIRAFLAAASQPAATLGRVVLQCYYRDDRVLRALGHEARPPFPKGYTLEQGDWSLLDAVRDRPRLWRDDRGA